MVGKITDDDDSEVSEVVDTTDTDDEHAEEEYIVEKVVDHAEIDGVLHYFLKWKNYSHEQNTWEPRDNLDCDDLIQEYHDRIKKRGAQKGAAQSDSKEKDAPAAAGANANKGSVEKARKTAGKPASKKGGKGALAKRGRPRKRAEKEEDDDDGDADSDTVDLSDVSDGEEYVVEKILNHRYMKGVKEYHVKWKGYSDEHNTWEPVANVFCTDLIKAYEDKVAEEKKTKKRPGPKSRTNTLESPPAKKTKPVTPRADPEPFGFDRGLEPKQVVGATDANGSLEFLIEWEGSEDFDLIDNLTCREKIPQLLLDFYERNLKFQN